MKSHIDVMVSILTAVTMVLSLMGLIVRFVLLPYLKEHLIKPMKQVEKQVTENHHSNEVPTVLDRIDDVSKQVGLLATMFDGHLSWSEEWVTKIERELGEQSRKRGKR